MGPQRWDVTVGLAATGKSVTAAYRLESRSLGKGRYTVQTTRSLGDWTEGSQTTTFDSAEPRPSDPWPFRAQHAIAEVPAEVRFDKGGRPVDLVDTQAWRDGAWAAVTALHLPAAAAKSTGQLVDPAGWMRDLTRSFPGTPPRKGRWERIEDLAGFGAAVVVEDCARAVTDGLTRWTCVGTASAEARDGVTLSEVKTHTEVEIDSRGLLRSSADRQAILIAHDDQGRPTHLEPWAQQRAVERLPEAP